VSFDYVPFVTKPIVEGRDDLGQLAEPIAIGKHPQQLRHFASQLRSIEQGVEQGSLLLRSDRWRLERASDIVVIPDERGKRGQVAIDLFQPIRLLGDVEQGDGVAPWNHA